MPGEITSAACGARGRLIDKVWFDFFWLGLIGSYRPFVACEPIWRSPELVAGLLIGFRERPS
jgi:hypothetical protein